VRRRFIRPRTKRPAHHCFSKTREPRNSRYDTSKGRLIRGGRDTLGNNGLTVRNLDEGAALTAVRARRIAHQADAACLSIPRTFRVIAAA